MEKERFRGICSVAAEGKLKWVENREKAEAGRVLACSDDKFEVEAGGGRRKWDPEKCDERTYGYRPVYE